MNLLDLLVKVGVQDDASEAVEQISGNVIGKLTDTAKTAAKALAGMWAVKEAYEFGRAAYDAYSQFEQLSGGAAKIFDEIDQSSILNDANDAWRTLNMSANEYLAAINQTGAMFAQTMGDERGYEVAKTGMQAISDYATGTGRDINELNTKFGMITRSAGSYQSIADQFAGILPATSADFLEQAQAAGFLSDTYSKLTEVPIDEYQQAITSMLEKGVSDLGLAGNTAKEALTTLEGSTLAAKSAWQNLVAEFGKPDADIGARISDMLTAVLGEGGEGGLLRNVAGEVRVIAKNMIGAVSDGVASGFQWLVSNGPSIALRAVRGVVDAMTGAASSIGSFDVSSLFDGMDLSWVVSGMMTSLGDIGEILMEWAPDVAEAGLQLMDSLGTAIVTNAPTVIARMGELLGDVAQTIVTYGPALVGNFAQAFMGIVADLTSRGPQLVSAVVGVIGDVVEAMVRFLIEHGPDLLSAAGQMVINIAQAVVDHAPEILGNVAETVGAMIGYVAGAAFSMFTAAAEFIGGLLDGSNDAFDDVLDWFGGVPQMILNAIGDVGDLLRGIGLSIINGLWDGMLSAWSGVTEWVGGLADWIRQNKGPEEYDKRLLTEPGMWIMGSLDRGLTMGFQNVRKTLASETAEINRQFRDGLALDVSSYQDIGMTAQVRPAPSTTAYVRDDAVVGILTAILNAIPQEVTLDSRALVGALAPDMNRALGAL